MSWTKKKSDIPPIVYTAADKRYHLVYETLGQQLRATVLASTADAAVKRLTRHLGDFHLIDILEDADGEEKVAV